MLVVFQVALAPRVDYQYVIFGGGITANAITARIEFSWYSNNRNLAQYYTRD